MIYVASLSDYNNGRLHGAWIDADQEVEDVQAEIDWMLRESPLTLYTGEPAEEWAIHDYEGFHGFELSEYEDLAVVSGVAKGIAEHGEAFAAYITWAGTDEEAVREFRDHYVGTYESAEAWAEASIEEFGWPQQLAERLDPDLQRYVRIDYAAFARDWASHWHLVEGSQGVHVFSP